jgi:signal peptidase I
VASVKPRRSRAARILWGLSLLLALLLATKFFVADVYRISSESMRPTLFGGSSRDQSEVFSEWVLVRYGQGFDLERFELVVLKRPGKDPIVKRVVGLPGESIRIVNGDVFIDGKRLAHYVKRPEPILVFDDALHLVADREGYGFSVEQEPKGPWLHEAGVWHLKGAEIGQGRDTGRSTGMMFYNPDVRDGYLDQDGKRIAGFSSVNDVIVQCEFAIDHLMGRLRFQLSEAGDLFEARIRNNPQPGSTHVLDLIRSRVGSPKGIGVTKVETVEASLEFDFPLNQWLSAEFSNVDNCVTFECKELGVELFFGYRANQRFPGQPLVGDQNVGTRAGLGGEGLEARFRSIRILRDLHYTRVPTLDEASPGVAGKRKEGMLFLGPEEIFLLGDNSSQSLDSRSSGPLNIRDVVGKPVQVIWPPGRMRPLN